MKARDQFKWVSLGLLTTWLVLFVLFPNLMVVAVSFLTSDVKEMIRPEFSLDSYAKLIDPLYAKVLLHSIYLAGVTTIICLLVGYPAAWLISTCSKRVQGLLLFLIVVPFWTNSLIRTYAMKVILGNRGIINKGLMELGIIDSPIRMMYTETAVIIALVYILLPFMILPLFSAIEKMPNTYLEAARDLGSTKLNTFRTVVWPLTLPGVISGCLLVFLPALGMFYIADLLGGAGNLLIGNIIRDQILVARNWPFGAALSVSLIAIMGLLMWAYHRANTSVKEAKA
ncbi:spermidine/putrescine ABC transporter permease PotB [Ferrimonas lipolytica]|uniref:Spermidine/putrescine ABC transporter permease PotB n=1 Tax=Ferrimonas lipolytica TaxID=2724191 RepID=A0A6H1UC30_9GAMM|nr:spermidine/putrescine ABC transporter permease PotB [Ferrimonas lipolytica]QIZ76594.1 spermidine/putrescine ABC transporter permease PotB [Ferrimonas lipolytica]